MNKLKLVLQIFALFRAVTKDPELKAAVIKILETAEIAFDAIPGDFPDNVIDRIQELLGEPPDEV